MVRQHRRPQHRVRVGWHARHSRAHLPLSISSACSGAGLLAQPRVLSAARHRAQCTSPPSHLATISFPGLLFVLLLVSLRLLQLQLRCSEGQSPSQPASHPQSNTQLAPALPKHHLSSTQHPASPTQLPVSMCRIDPATTIAPTSLIVFALVCRSCLLLLLPTWLLSLPSVAPPLRWHRTVGRRPATQPNHPAQRGLSCAVAQSMLSIPRFHCCQSPFRCLFLSRPLPLTFSGALQGRSPLALLFSPRPSSEPIDNCTVIAYALPSVHTVASEPFTFEAH